MSDSVKDLSSLDKEIDFNDDEIIRREQEIDKLESQIVHIHDNMPTTSNTSELDEIIQILPASVNVEQGNKELERLQKQTVCKLI